MKMIKTNKKTKIVATLGPACNTREIIKDMIEAGVNVFRINFSHADYEDVKERLVLFAALMKSAVIQLEFLLIYKDLNFVLV